MLIWSSILDGCESSPCYNGGTCVDMPGGDVTDDPYGYSCDCREGLSGDRCHIRADECAPNPCGDNSNCLDDYRNNQTVSCISEFYVSAVDGKR